MWGLRAAADWQHNSKHAVKCATRQMLCVLNATAPQEAAVYAALRHAALDRITAELVAHCTSCLLVFVILMLNLVECWLDITTCV